LRQLQVPSTFLKLKIGGGYILRASRKNRPLRRFGGQKKRPRPGHEFGAEGNGTSTWDVAPSGRSSKTHKIARLVPRKAGLLFAAHHSFCFSSPLFPSELLERSSKRSAPLGRSCPVLLSVFAAGAVAMPCTLSLGACSLLLRKAASARISRTAFKQPQLIHEGSRCIPSALCPSRRSRQGTRRKSKDLRDAVARASHRRH